MLTYHRVLDEPDPMRPGEITRKVFNSQICCLSRLFNVLPLDIAIKLQNEEKLPARTICVTFDDGYADNERIALPILKKWGIQATFFIATGYMNKGIMWNDIIIEGVRQYRQDELDLSQYELGVFPLNNIFDKYNASLKIISKIKHLPFTKRMTIIKELKEKTFPDLPEELMMSESQVYNLHQQGMQIGAHTVNHPILKLLSSEEAFQEVDDSKTHLESIINKPVLNFAYPNGRANIDYSKTTLDIVKACGFKNAVTTEKGAYIKGNDTLQIPRYSPWAENTIKFCARTIMGYKKTANIIG